MQKVIFILIALVSSSANAAMRDDQLQLLKNLVEINSGTKNVDGVNKVQQILENEISKLGFETSYVENPINPKKSGKFLIGILNGKQKDRFITIITHADTVFEPESGFRDFRLSADGKTAFGPGVGDDKGGLVAAIFGLKYFLAETKEPPEFSIRFISVPNEEDGAGDFIELFKSFSKDTAVALGFEPANSVGSIVEGRSGLSKFSIRIKGKEAHAGTAHKDGASACQELVIKLEKLQRLTDYKKGVTVNVGFMTGGSGKYNIVCASAEAKVETRFTNAEVMDQTQKRIYKILDQTFVRSYNGKVPTVTEYKLEALTNPFSVNKLSKPYIAGYGDILKRLEQTERKSVHTNGLGDISRMVHSKMIALDDLGPIGTGEHTKDESIETSSVETRAKGLSEFLPLVMMSKVTAK